MDSTTIITQIESSQSQKEVTANGLFDAASPAMAYGRHAETCSGLTWGYYGTRYGGDVIANGTHLCTASETTYMIVESATGAVSFSTDSDDWDDEDYARAYLITTGPSSVTGYEDHRFGPRGLIGGGGGGGGLTYFIDAHNNAAPNAATPVVSLAAVDAASNVDIALLVKGSGAVVLNVPDATAAGGNKRGQYACDLQRTRASAAQVASGVRAFIAGGENNTASANSASVVGGSGNTASGQDAVAAGSSNTSSGDYAASIGGSFNTSSGSSAVTLGGSSNSAAGTNSVVHGQNGSDRGLSNTRVHGGTTTSQRQEMVLKGQLIGPSAVVLVDGGAVPSATNQLTLANGSTYCVRGMVSMRQATGGQSACWTFECAIQRGANAADTAMLAACTPVVVAASAGASGWTLTVDADTTLGCLRVTAAQVGAGGGVAAYATCVIDSVQTVYA